MTRSWLTTYVLHDSLLGLSGSSLKCIRIICSLAIERRRGYTTSGSSSPLGPSGPYRPGFHQPRALLALLWNKLDEHMIREAIGRHGAVLAPHVSRATTSEIRCWGWRQLAHTQNHEYTEYTKTRHRHRHTQPLLKGKFSRSS